MTWAVTGRWGGESSGPFASLNLADHVGDEATAVAANRAAVRDHAGATDIAIVRGIHGADVAWIHDSRAVPVADALFTDTDGLPLVVLGADCMLIGLAAPGVIGVVHCGWRGLVAGVVPAALDAVRARTTGPIVAILGPGICVRCFPVGTECADAVRAVLPAAVPDATHVDLRAGVMEMLQEGGAEVRDHWRCTYESPELFSHRRDNPTGRHALVLWRGSARMDS